MSKLLKWPGYTPLTHVCIPARGVVQLFGECECSGYKNIWQDFWYSHYDDDGDDDGCERRGGVK